MVLAPGEKDLAFLRSINKEAHALFFPEIKLMQRDFREDVHDQLYGESRDSIYAVEPVFLPAFVDYSIDQRKLLTIFGKDNNWDLVIWCSVDVMEERGVDIKVGDVFVIDEVEYSVQERSDKSFLINQGLYLERAFATKIRRGLSIDDNRADFDSDGPDLEEGSLGEPPIVYTSLYPEK